MYNGGDSEGCAWGTMPAWYKGRKQTALVYTTRAVIWGRMSMCYAYIR